LQKSRILGVREIPWCFSPAPGLGGGARPASAQRTERNKHRKSTKRAVMTVFKHRHGLLPAPVVPDIRRLACNPTDVTMPPGESVRDQRAAREQSIRAKHESKAPEQSRAEQSTAQGTGAGYGSRAREQGTRAEHESTARGHSTRAEHESTARTEP
jgi:hypothetical protein